MHISNFENGADSVFEIAVEISVSDFHAADFNYFVVVIVDAEINGGLLISSKNDERSVVREFVLIVTWLAPRCINAGKAF